MKHLILTTSILGLILIGCEGNEADDNETAGIEVSHTISTQRMLQVSILTYHLAQKQTLLLRGIFLSK